MVNLHFNLIFSSIYYTNPAVKRLTYTQVIYSLQLISALTKTLWYQVFKLDYSSSSGIAEK